MHASGHEQHVHILDSAAPVYFDIGLPSTWRLNIWGDFFQYCWSRFAQPVPTADIRDEHGVRVTYRLELLQWKQLVLQPIEHFFQQQRRPAEEARQTGDPVSRWKDYQANEEERAYDVEYEGRAERG